MRRRKAPDNALSLFAFQDIITGTAGVMLFILMLLVVQLAIQATVKQSESTDSEASMPETATPTTRLSQADIQKLQNRLEEILKLIERVESQDPNTLLQRTSALVIEYGRIQEQLSAAEVETNAMSEVLEARKSSQKTAGEKEKSMRDKIAEMESDLREIENHPQVNYTVPEAKSGMFLVDVGESEIQIIEPAPLPRSSPADPLAAPPPERRKTSLPYKRGTDVTTIVRSVRSAVEALRSSSDKNSELDCLLVIRPQAAGIANQLIDAFYENRDWRIALELLDQGIEVGVWARVGKIQE